MKHKYIKNFGHFINTINQVISTHQEIDEEFLSTIGDDKFYYDYVYTQPYCDQFTWEIKNGNIGLLQTGLLKAYYDMFIENGHFIGRNYNNGWIKLSDELKNK